VGNRVAPYLLSLSASRAFARMVAVEEDAGLADLTRSQLTGDPRCAVYTGNTREILKDQLVPLAGMPIMFWIPDNDKLITFIKTLRTEKDYFVGHQEQIESEITVVHPPPVPDVKWPPIKEEIGMGIGNMKGLAKIKSPAPAKDDKPIDSVE